MTVHLGSGALIRAKGIEYLLTSAHIAYKTDYNPLVNINGDWVNMRWTMIGGSKASDLTVLRSRDRDVRSPTPPPELPAAAGLEPGQAAIAAGFPGTDQPIDWIYCRRTGRPKPITAPVLLYPTKGDMQHASGYLSYGYSGGAIVTEIDGRQIIVGIIAEKHTFRRKKAEPQHAGLIRYSPIRAARQIINSYNRAAAAPIPKPRTRRSKASTKAQHPPPAPRASMMLEPHIQSAILMLGANKPRC